MGLVSRDAWPVGAATGRPHDGSSGPVEGSRLQPLPPQAGVLISSPPPST